MQYLLDTNMCIYMIKEKPEPVVRRLKEMDISDIGISSITLSELEYGVEKSQHKDQNRVALAAFIAPLEILPYDVDAARHYGAIRARLEAAGLPIGPLDMLIAAHAISSGTTLVTNNEREFRRIPSLRLENWAT